MKRNLYFTPMLNYAINGLEWMLKILNSNDGKERVFCFILWTSNVNYLLGNFDRSLQSRHPESHSFPIKIEHPSTKLYHNCISHRKLPPQLTPPLTGQGNYALFDDLPQEAQ
ncbi:hypothetical protein IEQ34_002364 [Dendrobium chrysotoxum]|uniref:Uncharacterized protein n=1 Tax=Dendrobium chrysotoxum TaxID=161865 RepID=A0AAV7HL45_DENCH|nr:hypothetical protein IEQ34_002364 [Dendrobium chrysotoxum]